MEASEPADAELLAQVRTGDRHALAALYDRHAPLLLARARLLAALAESNPQGALLALSGRLTAMFDLPRQAVEVLLARCASDRDWETSAFAGVQLFHFDGGPGRAQADCGFVRIAANGVLPTHTHGDPEFSLVLQGSVASDNAAPLLPGDVLFMPPGSVHQLQAGADGVLFAVVMRMQGLDFAER